MRAKTRLKVRALLAAALIALICSFVIKEEASLFFLVALLACFFAGLLYSIDFYPGDSRAEGKK